MSDIIVALGDFHLWLIEENDVEHCAKAVAELSLNKKLKGYELPCGLNDLTNLFSKFPDRFSCIPRYIQKYILKEKLFSIHLPDLKTITEKQMPEFVSAINRIVDYGLTKEFTIHPDDTISDEWSDLLDATFKTTRFSIENMDKDKRSFRSLGEIARLLDRLPQLVCTFDLCHWLEQGHASDAPELLSFIKKYKSRISKIHFSVPSSKAKHYTDSGYTEDRHFLVFDSGWNISKAFYDATQHIPYVIEGTIPVRRLDVLFKEMELIQRNTHEEILFDLDSLGDSVAA